MKLLAQSLIPVNPAPYLHLGYSSAMMNNETIGGIFFGVIGIALVIKYRKRARHAWLCGIVCFLLCVACFVAIAIQTQAQWPNTTRSHAAKIAEFIDYTILAGNPVPHDISMLLSQRELSDYLASDGWGNAMRLRKLQQNDQPAYLIQSAGPDGYFDNADDYGMLVAVTPDVLTYGQMSKERDLRQQHKPGTPAPEMLNDAWGHRLRVTRHGTGADTTWGVQSAGKDGVANTADDLTLSADEDMLALSFKIRLPTKFLHGAELQPYTQKR